MVGVSVRSGCLWWWLLLRVVALAQKCRSLLPIFHPLVSSRRGNFAAEHRTLLLYSCLFMSEEPCTKGFLWGNRINAGNAFKKF